MPSTRWINVTGRMARSKGTTKEYWQLHDTNIYVEWFPKLRIWRVARHTLGRRGHMVVTHITYLGRFDNREDAQNFAEATHLLGETS